MVRIGTIVESFGGFVITLQYYLLFIDHILFENSVIHVHLALKSLPIAIVILICEPKTGKKNLCITMPGGKIKHKSCVVTA